MYKVCASGKTFCSQKWAYDLLAKKYVYKKKMFYDFLRQVRYTFIFSPLNSEQHERGFLRGFFSSFKA